MFPVPFVCFVLFWIVQVTEVLTSLGNASAGGFSCIGSVAGTWQRPSIVRVSYLTEQSPREPFRGRRLLGEHPRRETRGGVGCILHGQEMKPSLETRFFDRSLVKAARQ